MTTKKENTMVKSRQFGSEYEAEVPGTESAADWNHAAMAAPAGSYSTRSKSEDPSEKVEPDFDEPSGEWRQPGRSGKA
jgi:hypothetical protein